MLKKYHFSPQLYTLGVKMDIKGVGWVNGRNSQYLPLNSLKVMSYHFIAEIGSFL